MKALSWKNLTKSDLRSLKMVSWSLGLQISLDACSRVVQGDGGLREFRRDAEWLSGHASETLHLTCMAHVFIRLHPGIEQVW